MSLTSKEYNRQYYIKHRDKLLKQSKIYISKHKDKTLQYQKEYRENNRENNRIYAKEYYKDNKDKLKLQMKQYHLDNIDTIRERKRNWNKNNPNSNNEWRKRNPEKAKLKDARKRSRRKQYGFNLINKWFKGSDAHHLNYNDVLCIPRNLHKSIYHRQDDLESMFNINKLALDWYWEQIIINKYDIK